jgi:predicted GNAT superfamily acetyltransferase
MTGTDTVRVVPARPEHATAMYEIADSLRLDGMDPADAAHRGFLVSDFTVDTYRQLISDVDHCYVAMVNTEMAGFLVGYDSEQLNKVDDPTANWMTRHLDGFTVIKQVGTHPRHRGAGVGRALYRHLMARTMGRTLIAAVVNDPPNDGSRRFHRRLGFSPDYVFNHPDGRPRSVWVHQPDQASEALSLHQHRIAIDLYVHEDNLNWAKLKNYLYITVATAAALGFILEPTLREAAAVGRLRWIGLLITGIGLLTSLGFTFALSSGLIYLDARKQAAAEIEDMLSARGGVRIVGRRIRTATVLRRSPTRWVLRLTPVIGLVFWIAMVLFVLFGL